jgi:predicted nucleotidyltransferase
LNVDADGGDQSLVLESSWTKETATLSGATRPETTDELRARLAAALPALRAAHPIRSIGVFGSWARGEQTPESDVDLLIEFDAPVGFFEFFDIQEKLETVLGVRVDLVTPRGLRPQLVDRVMRDLLPA